MSGANRSLTDARTATDVESELVARAQAWLPEWQFNEIPGDFGRALLTIAARMSGRVIDGLGQTLEKNQLGLLAWLGIAPLPPQAASMPVFFQLAPNAVAVDAPAGTRLQASLAQPTLFETQADVQVVPGTIAALVGVNPGADQYFVPSAGMLTPGQPASTQARWTTLAQANYPPAVLQLSSANGLAEQQILLVAGRQFRITGLQGNVVTLSAPGPDGPDAGTAPTSLPVGTVVELESDFSPFGPDALGNQEHSFLLGDDALLNLSGPAIITVLLGGGTRFPQANWSYWGATSTSATPGWQPLTADNSTAGVVTLTKDVGSTGTEAIDGITTRWLRATLPGSSSGTLQLSSIQLKVQSGASTPLQYQALWNNLPLVVTSPGFLPLGPMPRQFDCFYIACAEAFGKSGAFVTLAIDAASPGTASMAVWHPEAMMFGVGKDGRLQRLKADATTGTLQFLSATQPKESDAARGPSTGNTIRLSVLRTAPALVEMPVGGGAGAAAVLVTSHHRVWMWTEPQSGQGFWTALGELDAPIDGLAALGSARSLRVIALSQGRLRAFQMRPDHPPFSVQWEELPAPFLRGGDTERIATVGAVRTLAGERADELVVVSANGHLRLWSRAGWHAGPEALADTVDPAVVPLVVDLGGGKCLYIVKVKGRHELRAYRSDTDAAPVRVACVLVSGFEVLRSGPDARAAGADGAAASLTVLMVTKSVGEAPRLTWWRPFNPDSPELLYSQLPPPGPKPLAGTPAVVGDLVVTSGPDAQAFVSPLRRDAHFTLQAHDIFSVALFAPGSVELRVSQLLVRSPPDKTRAVSRVTDVQGPVNGNLVASFDERLSRPDAVAGFRLLSISAPAAARMAGTQAITLRAADATVHTSDMLMLGKLQDHVVSNARLYDVQRVEAAAGYLNITLDRELHLEEDVNAWVVTVGEPVTASVRPALPVEDGATLLAGAAGEAIIAGGAFYATDSDPSRQDGGFFVPAAQPFAVLAANWKRLPKHKVLFDSLVLPGTSVSAPTSDSPDLQWQYWNGTSWCTIPGVQDAPVDELMQTGTVTFYVPQDLAATTVAGKKDTWIRACLMSGNYGLETYTVTPSPAAGGGTSYTAVPDDSSVNPPMLNSIDISYSLCQPTFPQYVVSYDNGSYDNQSDANRAGTSAVVQAFVPLQEALTPAQGAAAGPALYLGLDTPPDPGTVLSLLWEVNERDFSAVLPLSVAAVDSEGGAVPQGCGDNTRALGETNLLTVSLSASLTQLNLFGQSLYWLRLQPSGSGWSPDIRGVYLNGAWAKAQETQQMEVLGSATGEPGAQFVLLRPPVLDGTLQLRVLEVLSDADRAALMTGNAQSVVTNPGNLTGDWVLWQQVADTADSGPNDRVYSLDSAQGVITFGDGIHGKVPPVGKSNIIAFRYQRGGGSAANAFTAWSSLSLVSPVQGVATVLAPEDAAGGSDATPADALMRIAPAEISQRGRAITPRDLESQALQSSPQIVQARVWQTGGRMSLVTLVSGTDVSPSLAQLRALQEFLQARVTPGLAAILDVSKPRLVDVSITIVGSVPSFDVAAQVSKDVSQALDTLFDPQTGGLDGAGWPLGQAPVSDDIVAALNGVQNLAGIVSILLATLDSQGNTTTLPASFAPDQFPVLIDSGVLFSAQVTAA